MYNVLSQNGIPTPQYIVVNHLDPEEEAKFIEHEDSIEFNGKKLKKPFVEKSVSNVFLFHCPR